MCIRDSRTGESTGNEVFRRGLVINPGHAVRFRFLLYIQRGKFFFCDIAQDGVDFDMSGVWILDHL